MAYSLRRPPKQNVKPLMDDEAARIAAQGFFDMQQDEKDIQPAQAMRSAAPVVPNTSITPKRPASTSLVPQMPAMNAGMPNPDGGGTIDNLGPQGPIPGQGNLSSGRFGRPALNRGSFGLGQGQTNFLNPSEVAAAQNPMQPPELTQNKTLQDVLSELLNSSARDTASEEAMVRELLAGTVGQGQADLNARMAASGFGTSGALGALSGDMRARAARDAAQEILSLQQGARDEQLARLGMGISGSAAKEQAALRAKELGLKEAGFEEYMKLLEAMFGSTSGQGSNTPGKYAGQQAEFRGANDEVFKDLNRSGDLDSYDTGVKRAMEYSTKHGGDFSGLERRSSPGNGVLVADGKSGQIYWDSETESLFIVE